MINNLFPLSNYRAFQRLSVLQKPLVTLIMSSALGLSLGVSSRGKVVETIFNIMKYPLTFEGLQIAYFFPLLLVFAAIFFCSSRLLLSLLFVKSFCFSLFATIFLRSVSASVLLVLLCFASSLVYIVFSFGTFIKMIQGKLTNRSVAILTTVIGIFAIFDYFIASPFLSAVIIQWKG